MHGWHAVAKKSGETDQQPKPRSHIVLSIMVPGGTPYALRLIRIILVLCICMSSRQAAQACLGHILCYSIMLPGGTTYALRLIRITPHLRCTVSDQATMVKALLTTCLRFRNSGPQVLDHFDLPLQNA